MIWFERTVTYFIENDSPQIPDHLLGYRGQALIAHAIQKLTDGLVVEGDEQAWGKFVSFVRRVHLSNELIPSQVRKAESQGLSIIRTASNDYLAYNENNEKVDIGALSYPIMSGKDLDLLFVLDEIWYGERDGTGRGFARKPPPPRRTNKKASSNNWGRIGIAGGALGMAQKLKTSSRSKE